MGFVGPFVFLFDELFSADESLRGQARSVLGAANGLNVSVGGLPPEAQSIISGLTGLGRRLEDAADDLIAAAADLGQTGAAAKRADHPDALDYAKALLLIAAGLAPETILRHAGHRQIAKLRRADRRNFRQMASLEHRRDLARRSGDQALLKRLDRDIENQRTLLRKSSHRLQQAKHDLRALRAAGYITSVSDSTLRALRHVSGALGLKLPAAVLSAREWHRAIRNAGSLPKAWGERALGRHEGRRVPGGKSTPALGRHSPDRAARNSDLADAAKRLGARRAAGALPIAGAAADLAITGIDAKRLWDDPNLGNATQLAADVFYDIGNIPTPPTLIVGNAGGVALDGAKFVGDNADDIVDGVGDAAGAAKGFVEDKVPFL